MVSRVDAHRLTDGRAYTEQFGEGVLDLCTEAERAVLQPPFHPRMSRDVLDDELNVHTNERSAEKMAHDKATFGTKFF